MADLGLLRAIDKTVDWLCDLQRKAASDISITNKIISVIISCEPETEIDPDDSICEALENWEKVLKETIDILKAKLLSARHDPELQGEREENVVCEYDNTIKTFSDLHDAVVNLRWAIMEHDADLSPVTGSFTNPNDLIAHLNSL
jgi:hypothetical protein